MLCPHGFYEMWIDVGKGGWFVERSLKEFVRDFGVFPIECLVIHIHVIRICVGHVWAHI